MVMDLIPTVTDIYYIELYYLRQKVVNLYKEPFQRQNQINWQTLTQSIDLQMIFGPCNLNNAYHHLQLFTVHFYCPFFYIRDPPIVI